MSNTDNIDKYGHCVVCHKNLLSKRVVEGQVVDMFLPTYDHTFFMLNDGSQMQVTICKPCKFHTDLTDPVVHDKIMQAVQKGWDLDKRMGNDPNWESHRFKLDIEFHSENITNNSILSQQSKELSAAFRESK